MVLLKLKLHFSHKSQELEVIPIQERPKRFESQLTLSVLAKGYMAIPHNLFALIVFNFIEVYVSFAKVKDKCTRDEDKDTRGNTRDRKASREGENHTCESASILHELYNDIGKLGLE
ncbi:hypothetical protein Tco_1541305 [Tanacetum coccineum]